MAFTVEVNVLTCPVAVGFAGARAKVATLALNGDAVEKAWRLAAADELVSPLR